MTDTNTTTPPSSDNAPPTPKTSPEDVLLAKRMFYAGLCGLPWLWICNVMYFRLRVFRPLVFVDYWPGQRPSTPGAAGESNAGGDNAGSGSDRWGVNGEEEENHSAGSQEELVHSMHQDHCQMELEKWVRRSTHSAALVLSVFVAWIVTFQVNKDSFGSNWFVMSESEEDATGW